MKPALVCLLALSAATCAPAPAAEKVIAARCAPSAATELTCGDGVDNDCDGFIDCLDPDCGGQTCGGAGLTCMAGACRAACTAQDGTCIPALPPIQNVRVTVHADTAIVDFEPVDGARDYRIYREPKPGDVLLDPDGKLAGARNAIYRCAGDRPFTRRADLQFHFYDLSLAGPAHAYHGYARSEAEAVLGYVYLTPGEGRLPVYRVADPQSRGGYLNPSWSVPPYHEGNSADYVTSADTRDRLLAQGFRDDGIAFYAPTAGTRPIYRIQYQPPADSNEATAVLYYTDGPEADARKQQSPAEIVQQGERFRVLADAAPGAVALHRVTYMPFDVLAAGEARYQRALEQGNQPMASVTWPGITEPTTFIVEALDAGCPFAGGYIAASHAEPDLAHLTMDPVNRPSITLDEARLATGEVFINGQHEPGNRPRPLARAYVTVTPEPKPKMDWYASFDEGSAWGPFSDMSDNNAHVFRNPVIALDTSFVPQRNYTAGPLLGQLVFGFGDGSVEIVPRGIDPRIESGDSGRYLHVRMAADVPVTHRRYPQILITTVPFMEGPGDRMPVTDVPVQRRLGMTPPQGLGPDMMAGTADDIPLTGGETIVVQPFSAGDELQIEFCDNRGWGVGNQCPRANLYGFHAGDYKEDWKGKWLPVPVLGDRAGFDRPVQFDVYASTGRVYVFLDDKPAGCAVLPPGRMPAGAVTVAWGAVMYHPDIDEAIAPEKSPHQYQRRYSLVHSDHHVDDLGISLGVAAPVWDEKILPCATRWYGGS